MAEKLKIKPVNYYSTSCCIKVLPEHKVFGIAYIPNLFDKELDYRIVLPKYSNSHCCYECFNKYAVRPAGLIGSGDNTSYERQQMIKPFAYKFLRAVFNKIFFPKNLHR